LRVLFVFFSSPNLRVGGPRPNDEANGRAIEFAPEYRIEDLQAPSFGPFQVGAIAMQVDDGSFVSPLLVFRDDAAPIVGHKRVRAPAQALQLTQIRLGARFNAATGQKPNFVFGQQPQVTRLDRLGHSLAKRLDAVLAKPWGACREGGNDKYGEQKWSEMRHGVI
jgi:hypothetical protein